MRSCPRTVRDATLFPQKLGLQRPPRRRPPLKLLVGFAADALSRELSDVTLGKFTVGEVSLELLGVVLLAWVGYDGAQQGRDCHGCGDEGTHSDNVPEA